LPTTPWAIPDNLIESELFGCERGAFTGADRQRKGKFEVADRGTIFLDEIGELSLLSQARLLHVLQDREIERLGAEGRRIPIDVRVIAATNRDLAAMVGAGAFDRICSSA
jgi:transcriptional regulator with GAF, ATPase, and Fis domain